MFKRSCLAIVLALGGVSAAHAEEVLSFYSAYGWSPGDSSSAKDAEGLSVDFSIEESPNDGDMYVRGRFCNQSGSQWYGGIRLTTNYPDSAHATINLADGECTRWSEHLEEGARNIYVFVNRSD